MSNKTSGGLRLNPSDVLLRDEMTVSAFKKLNVPVVMLGGGGYSKQSAQNVADSIINVSKVLSREC